MLFSLKCTRIANEIYTLCNAGYLFNENVYRKILVNPFEYVMCTCVRSPVYMCTFPLQSF